MFNQFNYPPSSEFNWIDETLSVIRKTQLSLILIGIAFSKLNATSHIETYGQCRHPILTETCLYPHFNHEDLIYAIVENQNVVTTFPGIYFFSCYEVSGGVTFSLYLLPFKPMMWIVAVILLYLSTFLLSLGFYALTRKIYPITIFLYFYASLVDEVSTVPAKLSTLLSFKVLSIPWLLVRMLLSNCYLSICITNLNSPFPGERFDTNQKNCLSR